MSTSSTSGNQCFRGINWGSVSVSDDGNTLDMSSLMSGDVEKGTNTSIFSVPLDNILAVAGTKSELQLQMKIPPRSTGIRMKSIKFAVPSPCVGYEQSMEAGKEMQAVVKSAVDSAGGGGGIAMLAAAVSAGHGATIAKLSNVTILQPNGIFNVTWTASAMILLETKRMLTTVVPSADIVRMYLLPSHNENNKEYLSIILKNPIRLGNTEVNNVVIKFDGAKDVVSEETPVMLEEECPTETATAFATLTSSSGGVDVNGRKGMHGPLANIASSLSKAVFQVPLTGKNSDNVLQVHAETDSETEHYATRCSLKGSDGALYILKKSLMFLHRPATCLPYADIEQIRVNTEGIVATFAMDVFVRRSGGRTAEKFIFNGIEKRNLHAMLDYFKKAAAEYKLKMDVKLIGADAEDDDDEDGGDDDDEETDESYKTGDDSDYDSDDSDDSEKKSKKPKKEKKDKSDKKSKKDKSDKKSKKDKSDKKSKKDKSDKKSKKDKSDKKEKKDKKAGEKRERD